MRFPRAIVIRYRFTRILRAHRRRRWPEIASEIAGARSGYVLLAGDSHAEHMGHPDFGLPVVNAGIGGTRASAYAADLDRLPRPPRAGLAVLVIGANDTARLFKPRTKRRVQAFDAAILRTLAWLSAHADVVLVAAIPPIRPSKADAHDRGAMRLYNQRLEDLCRSTGCRFIDPFAEVRADDPTLVRDEVATDSGGAHLADYDVAIRALASIVSPPRHPPPFAMNVHTGTP